MQFPVCFPGATAKVAAWQEGAWVFYTPRVGRLAYVLDENRMIAFKATG